MKLNFFFILKVNSMAQGKKWRNGTFELLEGLFGS